MARAESSSKLPPPYLRSLRRREAGDERGGQPDADRYPFNIPLFADPGFELRFERPVTIIVGENGSGKSTLLEAIAVLAGFSEGGGGYGHRAVAAMIE